MLKMIEMVKEVKEVKGPVSRGMVEPNGLILALSPTWLCLSLRSITLWRGLYYLGVEKVVEVIVLITTFGENLKN